MISEPLRQRQLAMVLIGSFTERKIWVDKPEGGQREPQEENKLEGVVEGEPVNHAEKALSYAKERVSSIIIRIGRGRGRITYVKNEKTTQYLLHSMLAHVDTAGNLDRRPGQETRPRNKARQHSQSTIAYRPTCSH